MQKSTLFIDKAGQKHSLYGVVNVNWRSLKKKEKKNTYFYYKTFDKLSNIILKHKWIEIQVASNRW